jgi:TorA maturation chaperone TorD
LRWIEEFAERVADRCSTRFYAGLALLTAAYLDELRDLLARLLDQPRPAPGS